MNYSDTNRPISNNKPIGAAAFVSIADYVTAQPVEPVLGVFDYLTHEELEAAHGRVRSFRDDWKFKSPKWESSYSHPCSATGLGDFLRSDSKVVGNAGGIKQFATVFIYDNGTVIWTKDHQWVTVMAVEGESFLEYRTRVNEHLID